MQRSRLAYQYLRALHLGKTVGVAFLSAWSPGDLSGEAGGAKPLLMSGFAPLETPD